MHGSYAITAKPSITGSQKLKVALVVSPKLFADSLSRTLGLSGWPVEVIVSDAGQVSKLEVALNDDFIIVIAEGVIPATSLAAEIRRRRSNQRIVVVSDQASPLDAAVTRIPVQGGVVELIKALESVSGYRNSDRKLTSRHLEILQLVAAGCTSEEVGLKLGIASKTVNNHLSAVYRRLRTRNLTQAVLVAAKAGWIDVSAI